MIRLLTLTAAYPKGTKSLPMSLPLDTSNVIKNRRVRVPGLSLRISHAVILLLRLALVAYCRSLNLGLNDKEIRARATSRTSEHLALLIGAIGWYPNLNTQGFRKTVLPGT